MIVKSEIHRWQRLKLLFTQSFLEERISLDALIAANLVDKLIPNFVDVWFAKPRPGVSFNLHLCPLIAQKSYLKLPYSITLSHFKVEENIWTLQNKLTDVRATAKHPIIHVQFLFQYHFLSNM